MNNEEEKFIPHPLADSECHHCSGSGYILFDNTCDCVDRAQADILLKFKCPTFETAPKRFTDEYDGEAPKCSGEWIKGSGGHRIHTGCDRLATWWHPDDTFAYCDKHCPAFDKREYKKLWVKDLWKELNQET